MKNNPTTFGNFKALKSWLDMRKGAREEIATLTKKADVLRDQVVDSAMEVIDLSKKVASQHVLEKEEKKEIIQSAVLIKAQSVHDYFYLHGKSQGWDDLRNFPQCKAPFPRMVISYDAYAYDGLKRMPSVHTDVAVVERKANDPGLSIDGVAMAAIPETKSYMDEAQPDTLLVFQSALEGIEIKNIFVLGVSKTGAVTQDSKGNAYVSIMTKQFNDEHFKSVMHRDVVLALATINFMNCRNVEIVDNQPTRQQRRAAEREGKPASTTYKTLVIHPVGKKRQKVVTGQTGIEMSLHICRGHFKDFRSGPGLGKFHAKGLWWWSPQVRGSAERGRVVKDYDVEVENESPQV